MGVLPCRRGGGLVSACGDGVPLLGIIGESLLVLRGENVQGPRVHAGARRAQAGDRVCRCWQSLGSRAVAAPRRFPVTARF